MSELQEMQRDPAFQWVSHIHKFLQHFSFIPDSFVLEFYEENHWGKLPSAWQQFLPLLSPALLADFIDVHKPCHYPAIPPLSLLAFRSTVKVLSLARKFDPCAVDRFCSHLVKRETGSTSVRVEHERKEFRNLFSRHVKPKKRHEVERSAQIVSRMASRTGATHAYDIGSGLGHLARYLAYGCGLQLTCVDKVQTFADSATKFDKELESFLLKKSGPVENPPSHLCLQLELDKHEQHFQDQPFQFGFTGLHSCGNLSPVILHNFVNSPATFLMSLGCCYMKMDHKGFPLSSSTRNLGLKLSYEALEVACHAIEQYCHRLRNGQVRKLMTHSYRAALETILVRKGLKRAGLRGVPHTEKLTFAEYALAATKTLEEVSISEDELRSNRIESHLRNWFRVVLFYSLRLMVANVVETAVLLDRALFIKESDPHSHVHVMPVFDPMLSPRNIALICYR